MIRSSFLVPLFALLSLSGCALFEQMQAANEAHYRDNYCSYDGAFALGSTHAQESRTMQTKVSDLCDLGVRAAVEKGYREGYKMERTSRPTQINIGLGGTNLSRECIRKYGRKVCGYDCKEAYGQVKCAQHPNHNCVEKYGRIKCGLNCRESYGRITCDG